MLVDPLWYPSHAVFLAVFHTWNETIVNPLWGLAIAVLATAGGMTRMLGNRITLVLGLVGGITFAMATATIAFTELFDPLSPSAR